MSFDHSTDIFAPTLMSSNSPFANSSNKDAHQSCPKFFFAFECGNKYESYRKWLETHHELYIAAIIIYLTSVYFGKKYMADRKAFNLAIPLFLWNTGLAIFSIMGAYRFSQEFVNMYSNGGFYRLSCDSRVDSIRAFWTFAFCLSKIAEFGDTIFLVLRKRPVIFLHWYHHVTVLMFTWNACAQAAAFGRLFILMNFIIHSFMYAYYALQAIRIRAPKFVSMFITTIQILQMAGGIFIILYAQDQVSSGRMCYVQQGIINSGIVMYGSYFVLFVNYFVNAYLLGRKRGKPKVKSCATSNNSSISAPNVGKNGDLNCNFVPSQDPKSKCL